MYDLKPPPRQMTDMEAEQLRTMQGIARLSYSLIVYKGLVERDPDHVINAMSIVGKSFDGDKAKA